MAKRIIGGNGRIMAVDWKFTGEEPTWHDIETLSDDAISTRLCKAFYFYSYYVENDDWVQILKPWFKSNGFTEAQMSQVKQALRNPSCLVAAKLIRCMQMGLPANHKSALSLEALIGRFKRVMNTNTQAESNEAATAADQSKRGSPFEAVQSKVRTTIMVELEKMLDSWVVNSTEKINRIDLVKTLTAAQCPAMGLPLITAWIDKQREEYFGALTGDEQLKEAYAYLSKKALMIRIAYLDKMLQDVATFKGIKNATRKKRVKKTKSVEQQIKHFKYQVDSKEHKLTSVKPAEIPGAQHLYVFNTKYRSLMVFHAQNADGLSIKGTTIQNFDEALSYSQSLRKPETILPFVLSKMPKAIEKEIEKLSTKKKSANGRINENCILLKTLQSRNI